MFVNSFYSDHIESIKKYFWNRKMNVRNSLFVLETTRKSYSKRIRFDFERLNLIFPRFAFSWFQARILRQFHHRRLLTLHQRWLGSNRFYLHPSLYFRSVGFCWVNVETNISTKVWFGRNFVELEFVVDAGVHEFVGVNEVLVGQANEDAAPPRNWLIIPRVFKRVCSLLIGHNLTLLFWFGSITNLSL